MDFDRTGSAKNFRFAHTNHVKYNSIHIGAGKKVASRLICTDLSCISDCITLYIEAHQIRRRHANTHFLFAATMFVRGASGEQGTSGTVMRLLELIARYHFAMSRAWLQAIKYYYYDCRRRLRKVLLIQIYLVLVVLHRIFANPIRWLCPQEG